MILKKRIIFLVSVLIMLSAANFAVFATHQFDDVTENTWYQHAVDFVYKNGYMSGTSENDFSPHENMSRAMLVTVLYRLAGSPVTDFALPFGDVSNDAYYYVPVMWCYENGIVAGTSPTKFSPDVNISREQLVTIFVRYAEYKRLDTSAAAANLDVYDDKSVISEYAVDAFSWAVRAGIVSGVTEKTLMPQGTATRAQCAVIIQRYVEWTDEIVASSTPLPNSTPVVTPVIETTPVPTVPPPILDENQTEKL